MQNCELRPLNGQDPGKNQKAPEWRQFEKRTALKAWAEFRKASYSRVSKMGGLYSPRSQESKDGSRYWDPGRVAVGRGLPYQS